MNRRGEGGIGDGEGQPFRAADDARECGICPFPLIVWCLLFWRIGGRGGPERARMEGLMPRFSSRVAKYRNGGDAADRS
jgi:hypothetical protein